MSYPKHEAPRELVAVLWSIAGIIAVFLAISVSSLFVLKTYFPVDADTADTVAPASDKCTGAEVSLNNYPGPANITKYVPGNSEDKTSQVTGPLGGFFQCSRQCIPGLAAGAVDSAARTKVEEFLTGGSIAGKPIVLVTNGEAFMQKWKQWNDEKDPTNKQRLAEDLKRTVIVSQTKPTCQGPNSKDYDKPILGKGGVESPRTAENTTVQDAAQQGKTDTTGTTGARTTTDPANAVAEGAAIGAVPGNVNLPVGESGNSGGGSTGGSAGSSMDLKTCKSKINTFLNQRQRADGSFVMSEGIMDNDILKKVKRVAEGYAKIKTDPAYTNDESKSLNKCLELYKLTQEIEGGAEVIKCKAEVNSFLASYKNNQFTGNAKKFYNEVSTLYTELKWNSFWSSNPKKQLELCKSLKQRIQEFKVTQGSLQGPAQKEDDTGVGGSSDTSARIDPNIGNTRPQPGVTYFNGLPQPKFVKYYDKGSQIAAVTSNPDGRASLIIDKRNNVYWSMHVRHQYGNQVARTITIVAPVTVYSNRTFAATGPWKIQALGNIDAVYMGENLYRVSSAIFGRIYPKQIPLP